MYLSHYNLKEKPFQISTDPKFLWMGEKHQEALATLKYGITDNRGFLLLTGDVGTGKTTLINALTNSLDDNIIVATVSDPGLQKLDFFNFIANAFKMDKTFKSKGDFLVHLSDFLYNTYAKNKKVLLIIDESQRLNQELLEEIRLLSNIERQNTKLINIFFVGQIEFNDILLDSKNRAIRQRITINYNIEPLTERDTGDYIRFRLKVAGADREIFDPHALIESYMFSKGYPRLINVICDHAMLTGFVKEVRIINSQIIRECANELRLPEFHLAEHISKESNEQQKRSAGMVTGIMNGAERIDVREIKNEVVQEVEKQFGFRKSVYFALFVLLIIIIIRLYFPQGSDNSIPTVNRSTDQFIKKADINQNIIPVRRTPDKNDIYKTDALMPLPNSKIIIHFRYKSNDLSDEAHESLDRLAGVMDKKHEIKIDVVGYADSSGVYSYNKSRSRVMANIVKSYLAGKGVDLSRIRAFGMGSEKPIEYDSTGKGRKETRRVEIELFVNTS